MIGDNGHALTRRADRVDLRSRKGRGGPFSEVFGAMYLADWSQTPGFLLPLADTRLAAHRKSERAMESNYWCEAGATTVRHDLL